MLEVVTRRITEDGCFVQRGAHALDEIRVCETVLEKIEQRARFSRRGMHGKEELLAKIERRDEVADSCLPPFLSHMLLKLLKLL